MNLIRNFICHNQKQIIKYEYTISQLHKNFKDSYYDEPIDNKKIEEDYEKLIIDSFDMIEDIYSSNIQYIENIFNLDDTKVRITIKMLLEDNTSLIHIYCNKSIDTKFSQIPISSDIGFERIMKNQETYYLNEDRNDKYQSSLIIPMSITNSQEDQEKYPLFYNKFFKSDERFIKQRTIFGFFCIDALEQDYFKKMEEEFLAPVDYGFIFADTLSLYLVFFYNYIISSETIREFEDNI